MLQIANEYGIRATLTVQIVFRGMPGTVFELLPLSQQPEHLRDEALLAMHTKDCGRPGWVQWADVFAWKLWQEQSKQSNLFIPNELKWAFVAQYEHAILR